ISHVPSVGCRPIVGPARRSLAMRARRTKSVLTAAGVVLAGAWLVAPAHGAPAPTTTKDRIITGAGAGGGPDVRVYATDGTMKTQFFAYDPGFRGGVRVAAGHLNCDGSEMIVTGAGPGGGPHVRAFN